MLNSIVKDIYEKVSYNNINIETLPCIKNLYMNLDHYLNINNIEEDDNIKDTLNNTIELLKYISIPTKNKIKNIEIKPNGNLYIEWNNNINSIVSLLVKNDSFIYKYSVSNSEPIVIEYDNHNMKYVSILNSYVMIINP